MLSWYFRTTRSKYVLFDLIISWTVKLTCNEIIKTINNSLKHILPNNMKTSVTYTDEKLDAKFQIKDKTKTNTKKHDFVYYSKFPQPTCKQKYLGKARRRIIERLTDPLGKDKRSDLLRHAFNSNYKTAHMKGFETTDSSYHNNRQRWKISKALFIKKYKPLLNT